MTASTRSDSETYISDLKAQVTDFCKARNWYESYNPKDLAIGVVTEASELLEHFRFQSPQECEAMLRDEQKRREIGEELADVLYFALLFSSVYGFDLSQTFTAKMAKNETRHPLTSD